jgi:LysM repeat protein
VFLRFNLEEGIMSKKLLLILAGVLIQQNITHAEAVTQSSTTDYDYSSVYFNLGAGWGIINNQPTGAFTGSAGVGYNFNRYFALEADWTGLPSNQWGSLSNYNVYTLNMKGVLPVSDSVSFYGKVGSGVGYSSWSGTQGGTPAVYQSPGSATSVVAQASIGTSLALGDHFNLYLENNSYFPLTNQTGSFGTTNATVFGFQYNFSAPQKTTTAITSNNYEYPAPVVASSSVIQSSTAGNITNSSEGSVVAAPSAALVVTPKVTPQSQVSTVDEGAINKSTGNEAFKHRIKTAESGRHYVIVLKNETLYRMSVNSGISQSELRRLNHLNGNTLVTGHRFYLN